MLSSGAKSPDIAAQPFPPDDDTHSDWSNPIVKFAFSHNGSKMEVINEGASAAASVDASLKQLGEELQALEVRTVCSMDCF